MLGKVLDERYQLVRLLGTGGMGNVYEAIHKGTGRRVAVKVIANAELAHDASAIGRFQREAKAAGSIETPHIAQILDAGTDRATGIPFIAMEFLVGNDVKELSTKLGPLDVDLSLRIAAQACMGLQKAHESGIVHRDIKPANLFLAFTPPDRIIVKVLDFGIAKLPSKLLSGADALTATTTGRLLGSPLFMSPEQIRGLKTLDHRTDIWSLGAVLYQALAGRPPFAECETVGQLMFTICSQPPPPVEQVAPWVRPEVAALIVNTLQIDAGLRFPTAQIMLEAILALLPGGIDIDASGLLSATGERAYVPSSDRAASEGTLSVDTGNRLTPVPHDSPRPSPPRVSLHARPGESSDSTMPSAQDETHPPSVAKVERSGRRSSQGLIVLVTLAIGAGVWVAARSQSGGPPAPTEPATPRVTAASAAPTPPREETVVPAPAERTASTAAPTVSGPTPTRAAENTALTARLPAKKAPGAASSAPPREVEPRAAFVASDPTPTVAPFASPAPAVPDASRRSTEPAPAPSASWTLERKFPGKEP